VLDRGDGAAAVDAYGWSTASNGEGDERRANMSEHAPKSELHFAGYRSSPPSRICVAIGMLEVGHALRTIDAPLCETTRALLTVHHLKRTLRWFQPSMSRTLEMPRSI
jgi:hypothetical protein